MRGWGCEHRGVPSFYFLFHVVDASLLFSYHLDDCNVVCSMLYCELELLSARKDEKQTGLSKKVPKFIPHHVEILSHLNALVFCCILKNHIIYITIIAMGLLCSFYQWRFKPTLISFYTSIAAFGRRNGTVR